MFRDIRNHQIKREPVSGTAGATPGLAWMLLSMLIFGPLAAWKVVWPALFLAHIDQLWAAPSIGFIFFVGTLLGEDIEHSSHAGATALPAISLMTVMAAWLCWYGSVLLVRAQMLNMRIDELLVPAISAAALMAIATHRCMQAIVLRRQRVSA